MDRETKRQIRVSNATNRSVPPYLHLVYAYHCNRCFYLWLGKDRIDYVPDSTITLPKSCPRCKSKGWFRGKSKRISVAQIRSLLKRGEMHYAAFLLSAMGDMDRAVILARLEDGGYSSDDLFDLVNCTVVAKDMRENG